MRLTEDQKQTIIDAGKIELSLNNLAILLNVPYTRLQVEFHNSNSEVFKLYEKSRIETNNKIIQALTEKAKAGDKAAVKARTEFMATVKFREERDKMLRGQ
jgi:hypothetical protein